MSFDPVRDAAGQSSSLRFQNSSVNNQNGQQPAQPSLMISPTKTNQSNPPSASGSSSTPRVTSLANLLNDTTTYRSSVSPVLPTARPTVSTNSHSIDMLINHDSSPSPTQRLNRTNKQHLLDPPMKPPPLPYNPQRVSAPGSVLVPLTDAERRVFLNPTNSLRRALRKNPTVVQHGAYSPSQPSSSGGYSPSQMYATELGDSRKRKRSFDDGQEVTPPPKRAKDRDHIAFHYNARPQVGKDARLHSPIFALKAFNNWIKSVLIQKWAVPALSQSSHRGESRSRRAISGRVLDIGVGKGGDLQKWQKAKIKELVALDIAAVSVNQARDRWKELRGDSFDAMFAQLDCYTYRISQEIPQEMLSPLFDVVNMQFCMHYAFETESKARMMLDNVTRYLRCGGTFIGTVPNSNYLIANLREARRQDPDALGFGNSVYNLRFDSYKGSTYGHRYMFFLRDAVEDVPEYVVYWDNFVRLADEYDLSLEYMKEFHEIYQEESENPEFAGLLRRMKVVDANGETDMDPDMWDAANVYLAFAFKKR